MLDEKTLAYPEYRWNGVMSSLGNIAVYLAGLASDRGSGSLQLQHSRTAAGSGNAGPATRWTAADHN